jgi:RNA polymerase sigma factor (sigma-70 family)
MSDSQALLAEYATNGSEAAFREIVSRYLDFVYSTALRLVDGNMQLAEDVTQMVFISLARHARSLSSAVMLGGWLHQRAFHLATKAARSERRRQIREREAMAMNNLHDDSNAQWRAVAPILDEAITQLTPADRTAILLRFFERRDFRSVGQALGSHEDAARMRVSRAVEKLHALLKARGATLSTTTLAGVLAAEAVVAAPPALGVATVSAALASATGGTGITVLNIITMTKLKAGLATALVLALATTAVVQHRSRASLRRENQSLREQVAQLNTDNERLARNARRSRVPLLPAPALSSASPTALPAEIGQPASLYALVTNRSKLTAAQLEPYLEANQRSAASLLAGFRTSGDAALLAEAMQKFPNDPQVAFEAAFRKDISAEERRQWLDKFKQSAGKNALPYYLSASEHFKAGRVDQAVEDMIAASDRRQFHDYSLDRIQADDEAYRAAGYSVGEARLAATSHLLLPQLLQVRDLSHHMIQLADSYRQAGDENSRLAALEMVAELGRRYSDGGPGEILISQLVGIHAERMALNGMDPNTPYGEPGQTVQNRIDELARERATVRELSQQADHLFPAMSEQDWITYHSRSTMFGEQSALRWLVTKHAQNAR